MKKIRNKIITISGEPASGKSTVVKVIKEKYEQKGFNVHIISIGQLFREVAKQEYAKIHPDKKDINIADIQADKSFSKIRNKIDKMVDKEVVAKKGEEINSKERPNDIYIFDSRLAWLNLPYAFAVRLTVNEKVAGLRVFNDKSRGNEDAYDTVDQAIQKTKQRKLAEIKNYKERYGADLTNPENYNLIADTSYSNPEELAEIIINGEELYREGKHCAKNWASPAHFLPLQLIETISKISEKGNTIESIAEDVKQNGYHTTPDGVVEIIEKDGTKFLLKGNHRVFGALAAGRTLIPFVVTNRDNELVEEKTELTNSEYYKKYLQDYADAIKYYGGQLGNIKGLKEFSMKDLLPINKILDKILNTGR